MARNRIKRVIRESFRLHKDRLDGLDVVVINNPAAAIASNTDIAASLDSHWLRCAKATNRETQADG